MGAELGRDDDSSQPQENRQAQEIGRSRERRAGGGWTNGRCCSSTRCGGERSEERPPRPLPQLPGIHSVHSHPARYAHWGTRAGQGRPGVNIYDPKRGTLRRREFDRCEDCVAIPAARARDTAVYTPRLTRQQAAETKPQPNEVLGGMQLSLSTPQHQDAPPVATPVYTNDGTAAASTHVPARYGVRPSPEKAPSLLESRLTGLAQPVTVMQARPIFAPGSIE